MGTAQDVRDWLAYHFNRNNEQTKPPPALATGWRAELVGSTMDDLLAGRVALRVNDPWDQQPLSMVKLSDDPPEDTAENDR